MGMHPLLTGLTEMTDTVLQEKMNELSKKLNAAHRMGYSDAARQLQMIINDYNEEISRRNAKKMAELADKNPEFKNIIDVG